MRIAFLGQKGIPAIHGGVERYVEELSTRLASRGHAVWVYVRKHYTPSLDRMYKGVYIVRTPSFHTKYFDTVTHMITSIIHLIFLPVDIIYIHSVGPALFIPIIRFLKPRARVVSVFQSRDDQHAKWGWFAKRVLRFATRMACVTPHATVTSSQALAQYARRKYKKETIQIYNGVARARLYKSNDIVSRLNLMKGEYFLMVTRFVPHKNIHTVISAFKKLSTKKKLVIVGGSVFTDEYAERLRELAAGDSRIVFTGFLQGASLWSLLAHAYAFVTASRSEGLPLSVLEAMSYGIPVIASNISEHRELLQSAGLYFSLRGGRELHSKMRYALSHPKQIFENGTILKHRASRVFNWEVITDEVELLFAQLLADSRVRKTSPYRVLQ